MLIDFPSVLAEVRQVETWSVATFVSGLLALGAVVAALVAWAVRVTTRR